MNSITTSERAQRNSIAPSAVLTMIVFAGFLLNSTPVVADTEIRIPAGDSQAFISAIESANLASEKTVIHLEAGAPYAFNLRQQAPEPITGDIVLLGDGAEFIGADEESFGELFQISEQGSLDISDIVIRDFAGDEVADRGLIFNAGTLSARDLRVEGITSRLGAPGPTGSHFGALIVNEGKLDLDRVRISEITVHAPDRMLNRIIVLDNRGNAGLQNVFISDSKALEPANPRPFGIYISGSYFHAAEGLASVGVRFSTLVADSSDLTAPTDVQPYFRQCYPPGLCASLSTRATMILGLPCPFGNSSHSGGFNLTTDDQCDGFKPSDLIGVSPGTVKFQREATGGVRMVLPPFSPALDRVREAQVPCPARDATRYQRPSDGDNDGVARCDIGAFENPEGQALLDGGENGMFYSAGSDGHYVTIEEVRPREYVIFWNTFDLDGNQAWVLAVGSRQGDAIVADGFFQPDGALIPGAGADVDTDALQAWGTITVTLQDCLSGTFIYDSELGQFGSGSFPLDRLSVTQGIGCND